MIIRPLDATVLLGKDLGMNLSDQDIKKPNTYLEVEKSIILLVLPQANIQDILFLILYVCIN